MLGLVLCLSFIYVLAVGPMPFFLAQALPVLAWCAADIMFMDIRMPGRTGVEVMQQAPRPAFPVVAMTAQVEEEMQVLFR